jgi:hypothetical protein
MSRSGMKLNNERRLNMKYYLILTLLLTACGSDDGVDFEPQAHYCLSEVATDDTIMIEGKPYALCDGTSAK